MHVGHDELAFRIELLCVRRKAPGPIADQLNEFKQADAAVGTDHTKGASLKFDVGFRSFEMMSSRLSAFLDDQVACPRKRRARHDH